MSMFIKFLAACAGHAAHGVVPEAPAALPEFQAVNHLGEARGREDLLGSPTVLWFFPIPDSPG